MTNDTIHQIEAFINDWRETLKHISGCNSIACCNAWAKAALARESVVLQSILRKGLQSPPPPPSEPESGLSSPSQAGTEPAAAAGADTPAEPGASPTGASAD